MIRINLLPAEILEQRKFEKQIVYVIIGGVILFVVLGLVYAFASMQLSGRNAELQQNLEIAAQLRSQAEAFAIFEEKEAALAARIAVADTALASRIDWGRIANEVSLVLPADVWLDTMTAGEDTGLNMTANVVDPIDDIPDLGQAAVAKTLIRLAQLEPLKDVWLVSSQKSEDAESGEWIIRFVVSTGLVVPEAPVTDSASSVPAPPTEPAQ
jgi:Tfp pilus assembly protein PilN